MGSNHHADWRGGCEQNHTIREEGVQVLPEVAEEARSEETAAACPGSPAAVSRGNVVPSAAAAALGATRALSPAAAFYAVSSELRTIWRLPGFCAVDGHQLAPGIRSYAQRGQQAWRHDEPVLLSVAASIRCR